MVSSSEQDGEDSSDNGSNAVLLRAAADAAHLAVMQCGTQVRPTKQRNATLRHVALSLRQAKKRAKQCGGSRRLDKLLALAMLECQPEQASIIDRSDELGNEASFLLIPEWCEREIHALVSSFIAHILDELAIGRAVPGPMAAAKLAGSPSHIALHQARNKASRVHQQLVKVLQ